MIFYVEISVIFRVCENALYDLVMNCLKKCFQTKNSKKVLDIVVFFKKNRRICNYLRIKRLFGLLEN